MNYRGNEAYDFSLFEDKKRVNVVEIPDNEKAKREKIRKKNAVLSETNTRPALGFKRTLGIVCVGAMVLFLFFFQINGSVKATETTEEIYQTEKQIEALKSEEVRLQMELDSRVSFENIEKTAAEMGMQKPDSMQMRYINIYDTDTAEITEESNIFEKLSTLF